MSHKNYSKYSGNSKNQNGVKTDKVSFEEVVTEFEELKKEEIVDLKEEDTIEVKPDGNSTGIVIDCSRLNVRKQPDLNAEVLCTINKNSEVMINLAESTTEEFYKVYTSTGVEGYCMKKYISIK